MGAVWERMKARSLFLLFALLCAAHTTHAQGLSRQAMKRAIEATVLVVVEDGDRRSEGSGTIIHQDGYVLTNFHVVGHVHPFSGGVPGTLYREDGWVTLWHTPSSRSEARPRWKGRVVREAPSLDLALIRIDTDASGEPLEETKFPVTPVEQRAGELSDRVFAVGYPLGIRTPSVTGGQISGFDINGEGTPAFIRVDAEFNPGNSGGGLLNDQGELIGVPTLATRGKDEIAPIRKARPFGAVPVRWISEMKSGIADIDIPIAPMVDSQPVHVSSVGSGFVYKDVELFFFRVAKNLSGHARLSCQTKECPADAQLFDLRAPRDPIAKSQDGAIPLDKATGQARVLVVGVYRRGKEGEAAKRIDVQVEPRPEGFGALIGMRGGSPSTDNGGLEGAPRAYEAAPEANEEDAYRRVWSDVTLGLGAVIDPLEGQSAPGGFLARISYEFVAYSTPPNAAIGLRAEIGPRLLWGSWRGDWVYSAGVGIGARFRIGKPNFAVELPISYLLSFVIAEDAPYVSSAGYDAGVALRFGGIAFGASWMEVERGEYSVLRALSANVHFLF